MWTPLGTIRLYLRDIKVVVKVHEGSTYTVLCLISLKLTYQLQHNSVMLVYVMEFKKLCFQYKSATFLKSSVFMFSNIIQWKSRYCNRKN